MILIICVQEKLKMMITYFEGSHFPVGPLKYLIVMLYLFMKLYPMIVRWLKQLQ